MKEEALKLADYLKQTSELGWAGDLGNRLNESADMIRKLVDELDKQTKENNSLKEILSEIDRQIFNVQINDDGKMIPIIKMTAPQTKQCKDCGEINPAEIHTCSPQTKPLSDEELFEILKSLPYSDAVRLPEGFRLFAKAIEERHGIK